jgi:hypothetical protein
MVALIKIAVQLLADAIAFAVLLFRPIRSMRTCSFAGNSLCIEGAAFSHEG